MLSNTNERDVDINQTASDREMVTTLPNQSNANDNFSIGEQVTNVIPIVEENFTVSKNAVEKEVHLEQRWISTTKKIEVPIRYQEIYINGKELESYEGIGIGGMFSKIKDKIKDAISDDESSSSGIKPDHFIIKYHKEEDNHQEKYNTSGEMADTTLFGRGSSEDGSSRSDGINILRSETEKERVIPIWAEEVVISKRMVKVGEVIVKKYRVTESQKVDVDIVREKLTIKYPDGKKEEINA